MVNIGRYFSDRKKKKGERRMENYHRMEGLVRGFANHRRIQILYLLEKQPELSVDDIADILRVHFKTISAHVKRLAVAGLVMKRADARSVRHKITDRAKTVLRFLNEVQ